MSQGTVFIGVDEDSRLAVDLEAGRSDGDSERGRGQIGEGEEAFVIGGGGADEAVGLAGQVDPGIDDHGAGRVLDGSRKRAGSDLGRHTGRKK